MSGTGSIGSCWVSTCASAMSHQGGMARLSCCAHRERTLLLPCIAASLPCRAMKERLTWPAAACHASNVCRCHALLQLSFASRRRHAAALCASLAQEAARSWQPYAAWHALLDYLPCCAKQASSSVSCLLIGSPAVPGRTRGTHTVCCYPSGCRCDALLELCPAVPCRKLPTRPAAACRAS